MPSISKLIELMQFLLKLSQTEAVKGYLLPEARQRLHALKLAKNRSPAAKFCAYPQHS